MVSHQATKEGLYSRIAQSCQVHWSNQWLTLWDSVTVEAPPWLELIARRKDGRFVVNLVNRGAGEASHQTG